MMLGSCNWCGNPADLGDSHCGPCRRGEPLLGARMVHKDGRKGVVHQLDREARTVRIDSADAPDEPWAGWERT